MLHKNGITIDPVRLTICHKGVTVRFKAPNGRSILFDIACRLIFGPPATHTELVEAVYENDPDGGPEWAQKGIEVRMSHLRKRLKPLALNVYTEKTTANLPYDRCWVRKWVAA